MNVLSIQSSVAYGRVGNRAAVFVLERLGHEVWPIDTVAFSNHPAHGEFRGRVVPAAEVADLVEGLAARGVLGRSDAVLSGYLGDPATAAVVADAVRRVRAANPGALYCCDPVIGEVGRGRLRAAGHRGGHSAADLVPLADVVTPNPVRAGAPHRRGADHPRPGARAAARALLGRGSRETARSRLVVATGLQLAEAPGELAVLAVTGDEAWCVRHPRRAVRVWGTGDALAALFLGAYLGRRDARARVEHAVAALDDDPRPRRSGGCRRAAAGPRPGSHRASPGPIRRGAPQLTGYAP